MSDWKSRIAVCEAAGMSRQEIADHCGLSYSALSDICSGATKEPRGMAAVKLFKLSDKLLKAATGTCGQEVDGPADRRNSKDRRAGERKAA